MLEIVVLGSAAGGGFPQWNCNDEATRRLRTGDPRVVARTQSSLAVSADGKRWLLLNASPDLRQQINEQRQLQPGPDHPKRSSPIAAVALTNADVDHFAGLLSLRESTPFSLYAHSRVLHLLADNSIFNVLNPAFVPRRSLPLDEPLWLEDGGGAALTIQLAAFPVAGKTALWREDESAADFGTQPGDTIGFEVGMGGRGPSFFYIPGCAEITQQLAARLEGAELVFFDGTLWRDNEMIEQGVGQKTGRRMGHMSCSGHDGSLNAFERLGVKRKVYIHMNNTNPLLIADSPERKEAEARGWEVAYDGMEIAL